MKVKPNKPAALKFVFGSLVVTLLVLALTSSITVNAGDKALNRAQKALRSGDFERAEQLYRELLAKNEQNAEARLGLSHALLKQRRLQDSFDHAARVLAIDPLSARAHALLGSAVLAAGDFRLSVEEFRTALSLNSDEAMAIAGLAMVDYYENRTAKCIDGLKRAAFIDPGEPDYLFNLGQAAARSERYKEAADAYEKFLEIAPRTDADRRARIRGLIDFLRYLGQQGQLYNLQGPDRTVIPFESTDNRPVIKVRINGSKEYLRFVLDTGSGMSVLSDATARRFGVKSIAKGGLARAVGGGGRFGIVYGYLDAVDIGDLRIGNVPVYIRHFYDETNRVDGYLGIAALSRLLIGVDYGSRIMTLSRRSSQTAGTAAGSQEKPVKAEEVGTRPAIDMQFRTTSSGFLSGEIFIEGITKPLNFIIDTGATISVLSEKAAALEGAQPFISQGRMRVFGAAGIANDVKTAVLPRIVLGSYALEKIDAAVLDLEPINETTGFQQSGILGGNFLRHFRVLFDFQRGVLRLQPLDAAPVQNSTLPPEGTNQ